MALKEGTKPVNRNEHRRWPLLWTTDLHQLPVSHMNVTRRPSNREVLGRETTEESLIQSLRHIWEKLHFKFLVSQETGNPLPQVKPAWPRGVPPSAFPRLQVSLSAKRDVPRVVPHFLPLKFHAASHGHKARRQR